MKILDPRPFGKTGMDVSRIGVGTAEIGFAYGMGPRELPNESDAFSLLHDAVNAGVTFFDTANYYQHAEERIGASGITQNPDVVVCTKCAQFLESGESFTPQETEKRIREQVEDSLKKLRIDALQVLLLHGPSAEQIQEGTLLGITDQLKAEGKIKSSGASIRGVEAAEALISSGRAEVIELAYSIADQRMAEHVLSAAESAGVAVINRSVFLKGVLAGKTQYLHPSLSPLKAVAEAAERIAKEAGMSITDLALRFVISESRIATSLVGTASKKHMLEAVEAAEKGPLPSDMLSELKALALNDADQIDPARWPRV